MQRWQDDEWLTILGFLGGKEQGVVICSLSHRFERLVMMSEQFLLDVVLNMVDNEDDHRTVFRNGTDLGRQVDRSGIRLDGLHWIDPTIQIGAAQTQALLTLVERTAYEDFSFHDIHYMDHDVRKAASAFCDRRGRYRLECVKTASGATEVNGFLFINRLHHMKVPKRVEDLMETDVDRWRKEVRPYWDQERTGSRVPPNVIALALRRLLQNTALSGRWSIVVYEAKSEADFRAFMQAGFRQAEELVRRGDGKYLYAIPAFMDSPLLPSWVVSSMPIMQKPQVPGALPAPTGADDKFGNEIHEALFGVMFFFGEKLDVVKLSAKLEQLVAEGASVERSLALHSCARIGRSDVLGICLRLADPLLSAVNASDTCGMTPLMCAVAGNPGCVPAEPDQIDTCLDELIACGADVNLTDAAGLSALGHLWLKAREGLEVDGRDRRLLHACWSCDCLADELMPSNGPTPADEAVRVSIRDHLGLNDDKKLKRLQEEIDKQDRALREFFDTFRPSLPQRPGEEEEEDIDEEPDVSSEPGEEGAEDGPFLAAESSSSPARPEPKAKAKAKAKAKTKMKAKAKAKTKMKAKAKAKSKGKPKAKATAQAKAKAKAKSSRKR